MNDLADLFPDFASRNIDTKAGRIFTRIGGKGPPLVLLHGFPETGVMWHRIAPQLAAEYTLVIPDLRGYGWSSAPASRNGEAYTKRSMADDILSAMDDLGYAQFGFVGHDRGARVGYRLALDHPGRLTKLALLDITPTMSVWKAIEAGSGFSPHWPALAAAEPGPETMISTAPTAYYTSLMTKWTKGKSLDIFDPRALQHYRAGWGDPSRIHAVCEDYRAGATQDRQADEDDRAANKTIACPVHILASTDYLGTPDAEPPLAAWRRSFAPGATGTTIDAGHFIAEENAEALQAFLAA